MFKEVLSFMIRENQYRALGTSGIKVSPLGIGTNRWEKGTNDEAVYEMYRSLVDAGVNFFDSAEIYTSGRSESLLGECLHRDGRRVVVATKFMPSPQRESSKHFLQALDASLDRLGITTVDLYYIHFPSPLLSVDKLMDFMSKAFEAGKIRSVGVSNFSAEEMWTAFARLEHFHIPLAANEVHYNLLHRQPEEDGVLDACRELGVALVAYRPLERGQLISSSNGGKDSKEENLLKILNMISQDREKTVSQVVLNWLLRKDRLVIPIPGATNVLHALENVDALSWELSREEFAAIDQASSHWRY
jgi:aryl-alcohol dehydrogenase-like predicted oxidoreductase